MATDRERIATLLRHGLAAEAIASVLDTDLSVVHQVEFGEASLPVRGGSTNIPHVTNVPDQTVTLLHALGEPLVDGTQDLATLWRVEGPGVWFFVAWYEVKPFDDNDYVGIHLHYTDDRGAAASAGGGPDARAFTQPSEILPGGWIRQQAVGNFSPDVLMPSQWREYKLRIDGFHYNPADPGDSTIPVLGDPQVRNLRVTAIRLDQ